MQYAIMEQHDKRFLIDANELVSINMLSEDFEKGLPDPRVEDVVHEDGARPALVYGAFKVNPDVEMATVREEIMDWRGCGLGYIKERMCHVFKFVDVVLFEDEQCDQDIPFAALVALPEFISIGDASTQAITGFIRYRSQMDPLTNLIYRPGLFAFKSEEKRIREELTEDNWKTFIDEERARRDASKSI